MTKKTALMLILASLAMLGPFSIDTYLPSFHSIGQEFVVGSAIVQQTLSVYLLCFAGMMLFHGTLSDAFGRRPVILLSLGVFSAASIGATLAPTMGWFIACRALQGLSAGAGTVVGRAMVRDTYAGTDAQRMLSHITMVFALAPAVAPVIGGWMQAWLGWRSIFAFLSFFGLMLWIACFYRLQESLPAEKRHPLHAGSLLKNYLSALLDIRFVLICLAIGLASVGFFIYVASAPHFIIDILRLPETAFAWLFVPLVGGMVIGASIAARNAHLPPDRLIKAGYGVMAFGVLLNLAYNLLFIPTVPWAVLPLALYTFGLQLASPALTIIALDVFPTMRGLAASLQSFVLMLIFSLIASIAPVLATSGLALSIALAVILTLSAVCLLILLRMRKHQPEKDRTLLPRREPTAIP